MKVIAVPFVIACLLWAAPAAAVCGDDLREPPTEQCDGQDASSCPGLCVPAGLPAECTCPPTVCGDGIVNPAFEQCDGSATALCANGCSAECFCQILDHFQCYEAKPATFVNRSVTVEDRFGTSDHVLRYPHRLCAPANKNDEGIVDETSHLTGYPLRGAFEPVPDQEVSNQFGRLRLDVTRPDYLMVPTARDGVAIPAGNNLDHFRCYKVRRSSGAPKFNPVTATVVDAFESVTVRVLRPMRLCYPANKNGEDPAAPDHQNMLLCYKTQSATRFGTHETEIENQFGPDTLRLIHRRELCLPTDFGDDE